MFTDTRMCMMSEVLKRGRWMKMDDTKALKAKTMYEGGASIAEVATRFGVSRQSMHGTLKRLGTVFRSKRRYGEKNHFYRGGPKAVHAAQNKLEKAIQRGQVTRTDTCEECGEAPPPFRDGRTAIQAHHDDYTKPLEVRWLCQPCHHRWHKENPSAQ